jgi:hypothetical protein
MRRRTKLNLSRETLCSLAAPAELRAAAGGLTTPPTLCVTNPFTHCNVSICKCPTVGVVCTA